MRGISRHDGFIPLARDLRNSITDAEKALWRVLRNRRLASVKFRRQQPIGPYIVDFVSFEHRLIIECDGGQHSDNADDLKRDAWLAGHRFRVMRFWNNDVLTNPEGVVATIIRALGNG